VYLFCQIDASEKDLQLALTNEGVTVHHTRPGDSLIHQANHLYILSPETNKGQHHHLKKYPLKYGTRRPDVQINYHFCSFLNDFQTKRIYINMHLKAIPDVLNIPYEDPKVYFFMARILTDLENFEKSQDREAFLESMTELLQRTLALKYQ
jgi:hypothetical protein